MRTESVTIAGYNGNNEDALVIQSSQQLFAVIDGVSSLVPYKSPAGQTGGATAAQIVREHLEAMTKDGDLRAELLAANEHIAAQMSAAGIDLRQKEALWGAAAAAVKLDDRHLTYAQTGDCMIFAVYRDDTIRVLTHPQVSHLEAVALEKWEEATRSGTRTRDELISHVRPILIQNRYQANTAGGYGVLNGESCSSEFLEFGRLNLIEIKAVILLTDGLFWPTARGEGPTGWEHTVRPILEKGLHAYAEELIALEKSDPECTAYPRFKPSDDKTGVVIHLPAH
ncbi:protein phosphatase 2C domain-containing protein [Brevibacillus ruminantium]|uniref:Protein phosphatase 2C domain-containing protein n=1 Tax=Brevibacillus ruminantium TaxID=2950604 RepID=A0ABY4WC16_9BACL|nr:protein phosphatase 2C domain-containing protein [Brevibacillus ruminantium]USG64730.1 protein phosphatase 2C domain-containing protein [Brevibacillus ruminantium]